MIRRALMALAPLAVSGCVSTFPPDVLSYADPASATTQIRVVRPASIIGEYHARQAVDPKPWGRRDNKQSPQSGGDS